MADDGGEPRLGEELLDEGVTVRRIADVEDLDGVHGPAHGMDGPEDRPHSAAPDLADDVILSNPQHRGQL